MPMSGTPPPQAAAHDHDHDHQAPEPDPPWFNLALSITLAALFGAGIYSAANAPPKGGEGEGEDVAEAHHLREEAVKLAKEEHWAESLESLTKAKKADPAGDKEEAVEHLRRIDEAHLRGLPPHEPGNAPDEKPAKGEGEAPHEGK
jgi:hypothetical protein